LELSTSPRTSRQTSGQCTLVYVSCRRPTRTAECRNACNVHRNVHSAQITSKKNSLPKKNFPPHACTPLSRISQRMHVLISTMASATERGEALPRLYLLRPIHRQPHATLLAVPRRSRPEHSRGICGLKRSAAPLMRSSRQQRLSGPI
jgi:hypothetical protein